MDRAGPSGQDQEGGLESVLRDVPDRQGSAGRRGRPSALLAMNDAKWRRSRQEHRVLAVNLASSSASLTSATLPASRSPRNRLGIDSACRIAMIVTSLKRLACLSYYWEGEGRLFQLSGKCNSSFRPDARVARLTRGRLQLGLTRSPDLFDLEAARETRPVWFKVSPSIFIVKA